MTIRRYDALQTMLTLVGVVSALVFDRLSALGQWVAIAVASLCALTAIALYLRKTHNEESRPSNEDAAVRAASMEFERVKSSRDDDEQKSAFFAIRHQSPKVSDYAEIYQALLKAREEAIQKSIDEMKLLLLGGKPQHAVRSWSETMKQVRATKRPVNPWLGQSVRQSRVNVRRDRRKDEPETIH
jgi:hypothetical protein